MCSEHQARGALDGFELVEGLAAREVHKRIGRSCRLDDTSRHALAFYLLDTHERGLHQDWGHSSTIAYAQACFDLSPRRTRELLWAGKKLRELPLVEEAFCASRLSWTKVLLLSRVVVPEHQRAWIAKAEALSCPELRTEVFRAKEGEPPREPGDRKGLPDVRWPVEDLIPRHLVGAS